MAVGEITSMVQKWYEPREYDTFKIVFPDNIDVTTKALLVGATVLVVCLKSFMIFFIKNISNYYRT